MFGRLRPPQLKPNSHSQYRADFCGSCQVMAGVGRAWSLATSYDIAFLHSVASALEDAPLVTRPCTALPWRPVQIRELSTPLARWLASVNLLLIEAKCRDDLLDGEAWKGKVGLKLLKGKGERAEEQLQESGFPADQIRELPLRQARHESQAAPTLEFLALPTSEMLGEVFAHLAVLTNCPEKTAHLRRLGQSVASAVYLKDALEDQSKDQQRGRFNAVQAGRLSPVAANRILAREVARARVNLAALDLSNTEALDTILAHLTPPESESPSLGQRLRKRQSQAGICEIFLCAPDLCCTAASCGCDPCSCCYHVLSNKESSSNSIVVNQPDPSPPPALPCPACDHQMTCSQAVGVEYDECLNCLGLWLDKGELEQLARAERPPHRLLHGRLDGTAPPLRPEGTRSCPRCAQVMSIMMVRDVRLDFCADCQGLFLDHGELTRFLEHDENPQGS